MRAANRSAPGRHQAYDGTHGRGHPRSARPAIEEVAAASPLGRAFRARSSSKLPQGYDHRLLVVNGELIATRRAPGQVIGDGVHTVSQLVEIANQDPRRGVGHEKVLTRLELDHAGAPMTARPGRALTADVPAPGGGAAATRPRIFDRRDGDGRDRSSIHPDNGDMAVRAIKSIGLDVGGVDFLSTDIAESYREIGGGICEVERGAGVPHARRAKRRHAARRRRPGHRHAVPAGHVLRAMPIAAITGTNGKTTTARMLAHILKMAGHTVGLTTTDGVYIDGQLTRDGRHDRAVSARMVLRDPSVDVAGARDRARRDAARAASATGSCDVGAVLNVQRRPPGPEGRRNPRATRRGEARRGRGGARLRRAECRRPHWPPDGRLHRRRARLLRDDDDPRTRW